MSGVVVAAALLISAWGVGAGAAEKAKPGCPTPEPCRELKLPNRIATGKATYSQTTDGTLSGINLGYQVDLKWKDEPQDSKRIVLYRSTSLKGPWKKIVDLEAARLEVKAVPDTVDGTASDLYYRLEAWSSSQLLRRYPTLRVRRFALE